MVHACLHVLSRYRKRVHNVNYHDPSYTYERRAILFHVETTVSLITKKYIFSALELVVGKHLDIREI